MNPHKLPTPKPLFLERMKKILKNDYENYLEALKEQPLRSIRCNTLKISPEALKKKLEAKNWKIKQPWKNYPEVMIVEGKFADKDLTDNKENEEVGDKVFNILDKSADAHIVRIEQSEEQIGVGGRLRGREKNKSFLVIKNPSISNALARDNFWDDGRDKVGWSRVGRGTAMVQNKTLIPLEPGELGRALEHLLGYYYVQELSSMLPVIALNPQPNERILDLCSAPGSKTTQISAEIKNTGTIIANEISLGRIKILASNLERCGVTNTLITKKDGITLCKKLKKMNFYFDKILVDAPCSGEGTLRSSPKTCIMWNIKTIETLSKTQKRLFESAFEILKPNGELVYSTCTHAPEENEAVVDFILKTFKDKIKIEEIKLPIKFRQGITQLENEKFNPEVKKCARIYPQDNNTEGFFLAKMRKVK